MSIQVDDAQFNQIGANLSLSEYVYPSLYLATGISLNSYYFMKVGLVDLSTFIK